MNSLQILKLIAQGLNPAHLLLGDIIDLRDLDFNSLELNDFDINTLDFEEPTSSDGLSNGLISLLAVEAIIGISVPIFAYFYEKHKQQKFFSTSRQPNSSQFQETNLDLKKPEEEMQERKNSLDSIDNDLFALTSNTVNQLAKKEKVTVFDADFFKELDAEFLTRNHTNSVNSSSSKLSELSSNQIQTDAKVHQEIEITKL